MRSKMPAQLLSFKFRTVSLPKASPSLTNISTRRKSGHCLGTFKAGYKKAGFLAPLKCSVSHYLPYFRFSLSLKIVCPPYLNVSQYVRYVQYYNTVT
jgi:hypothetical protein